MENKEPRTFEEYNFQEFLKMKKVNDTLKKENQQLQDDCDMVAQKQQDLLNLCSKAFKGGEVEIKDSGLISVYLKDKYIGCYFESDSDSDKETLSTIRTLIEMFNAIPQREEK